MLIVSLRAVRAANNCRVLLIFLRLVQLLLDLGHPVHDYFGEGWGCLFWTFFFVLVGAFFSLWLSVLFFVSLIFVHEFG